MSSRGHGPAVADALALLGHALGAMGPYRDEVLVVGTFAPYLYRYSALLNIPRHPALPTTDVDLALPPHLRLHEGPPLRTRLLAAGLVEYDVLDFGHRVAARKYQRAGVDDSKLAPVHLEFLVPLFGKDDGSPARPEPEVVAERLKYLDLLAFEPLSIDAATVGGLGLSGVTPVRIPTPLSYVLHKVLIRPERLRRKDGKAEKDLASVYDAIVASQPLWGRLPGQLERMRGEAQAWNRWIDRALPALADLFSDLDAPGPLAVAAVLRALGPESAPSQGSTVLVVQDFLDAVGYQPR
ncbi:nucleotidyltransferase domain-containing protein [Myxococcota bacterium]|nr:nucleotidyltransferase domain-containing protein [Myxococcota bacterium]